MSRAVSASAGIPYCLVRVCRAWEIPRSTVYFRRTRATKSLSPPKKRGPKPRISDKDLVDKIQEVLEETHWTGEGYRKVWARLRFKAICVSRKRVLRLMREHSLLAKDRPIPRGHSKDHKGSIIPDQPDKRWGTDATSAGKGLSLRHDHGSPFVSDQFQKELKFAGVSSSPAYVREPETNGCAERFVKTLKEQLLWVRRFDTVKSLNQALQGFLRAYNNSWIVQRHGYLTPSQARKQALEREEEVA
jgi:transposase InsO family protein